MSPLTLHGFGPSVYTRVVRLVLAEKALEYTYKEVNPFAGSLPSDFNGLHPFGRVPVLDHGGFVIFEVAAIAQYLDRSFPEPALCPNDTQGAARMIQVLKIVDDYGYFPMVRQVFAHRVFRQTEGLDSDESEVEKGLAVAIQVLEALDRIASEGLVLNGRAATLADCHLAPMIAVFCAAPEGQRVLPRYRALADWWRVWSRRPAVLATDTGFDCRFP